MTTPATDHVMDRLLFGDNQFFGVNHMSEEKARAQAMRFQDFESVMGVLDSAQAEGIRTFMCTTHERVAQIVDRVRARPDDYPGFVFYPCMPYAHKYANAVTEHGPLEAVRRLLPDEGLVSTALRGGRALATKDVESLVTMLVDAEMAMFQGVTTPVIFLQNVVVDLLLGLGFDEAFAIFARHVRTRYGAEPGYITMNLPRLLDALDRVEVLNPIVCSNMNKLGFRMCGGIEAYREALDEREFRAVAMSVYASGALGPEEAFEWIAQFPKIESVVFGASSATNIRGTRQVVDDVWLPRLSV
ncbi:hypothetical protein [Nocardioides sp. 1609]|uniref:hypothetical protein n=1 Tax=Nocardioides sp. 1609 TaxID=2508327 RepID=UPI001ADC7704|nr:hypothetical protein [Nocardioides sp. 1609]